MKKIGILTLDGIVNYGNRLQNYAMQSILEKEGFKVETIIAKGCIIKTILQNLRTILNAPLKSLRFIKFNHNFINIRYIYARKWHISPLFASRYDFFVAGSDQVWNPNIRKRERNNLLLTFAKPEQRVAVAASLSVSELCIDDAEIYKKNISDFKAISIREFEGAEIIKNLCNRDVKVLCDPTLMLSRQEWNKMVHLPQKNLPDKYLLMYFLGDISEKRQQDIEKYADLNGLDIIKLNDKSNKNIYSSGPQEFLGLIQNASVVCTDSFHGTIFSIIFNVPFWTFFRDSAQINVRNMESRITTLQKKLGISNRLITHLSPDAPLEYDFTEVNKKIQYEKEVFLSFLKESFEKKEA